MAALHFQLNGRVTGRVLHGRPSDVVEMVHAKDFAVRTLHPANRNAVNMQST